MQIRGWHGNRNRSETAVTGKTAVTVTTEQFYRGNGNNSQKQKR